jgi:hypothetical protein
VVVRLAEMAIFRERERECYVVLSSRDYATMDDDDAESIVEEWQRARR